MGLVLTGLYSARNVPKNLVTAHSIVLVLVSLVLVTNQPIKIKNFHLKGRRDTKTASSFDGRKTTQMSKGIKESSCPHYERIHK